MRFQSAFLSIAFVLALAISTFTRADTATAPSESISQLQLQSSALTTIDELNLTAGQLRKIQILSAGSADPTYVAPDDPTVTPAYQDALLNLRNALAGGDETQIAKARADFDQAKGNPAPSEADFALSDSARAVAPSISQILSTTQYVKFIVLHASDIPDAAQTLESALDDCRHASEADFVALRERVATQVTLLCFGDPPQAHGDLVNRITALLGRARKMSDDEYQAERPDLQKSARKIISGHQGLAQIELTNWIDNQMARLLSNPELPSALAKRIRALRGAQ